MTHSRLTLIAALLLGCLYLGTSLADAPVAPKGVAIKVLLRTTVSGDASKEAIVASGELQPSATTGRHIHPGDEYGTVLQGELEISVDGQPAKRVKAGEAYHNARDVIHETRNVGAGVARIVSTFIIEKGQPISKPVP